MMRVTVAAQPVMDAGLYRRGHARVYTYHDRCIDACVRQRHKVYDPTLPQMAIEQQLRLTQQRDPGASWGVHTGGTTDHEEEPQDRSPAVLAFTQNDEGGLAAVMLMRRRDAYYGLPGHL